MKNKRITPAKANMMAMAKNGGLKGFMKGGGAYDGLIKAQDGFAQGAQYDKIHGLLEAAMKTDDQMNAMKANPFIAETFKNKTPALQAKYDKQSSDYVDYARQLKSEGITSYQKGGGPGSKKGSKGSARRKGRKIARARKQSNVNKNTAFSKFTGSQR
tara:strand:+ start:6060 stop:6533 length:474 start_codon:yes stop_codon:yes gene_type:complete